MRSNEISFHRELVYGKIDYQVISHVKHVYQPMTIHFMQKPVKKTEKKKIKGKIEVKKN